MTYHHRAILFDLIQLFEIYVITSLLNHYLCGFQIKRRHYTHSLAESSELAKHSPTIKMKRTDEECRDEERIPMTSVDRTTDIFQTLEHTPRFTSCDLQFLGRNTIMISFYKTPILKDFTIKHLETLLLFKVCLTHSNQIFCKLFEILREKKLKMSFPLGQFSQWSGR